MNNQQTDPTAELLRLPDEEYFSLSEERRMDLADAFSAKSFQGATGDPASIPPRLALGAPRRINLRQGGPAPILLASFETGLRAWKVNFRPNLQIFVKSRPSGELLHATPLVSVRRGLDPLPSAAGDPPTGAQAGVTATAVQVVDLLERMAGRIKQGEIFVTAVAYDVRSNTVRIAIDGAEPPEQPQAAKHAYVRAEFDQRLSIEPEIVVPARGSAKTGIRIRVARQFTEEDGILRTDLNQPFLPCHILLVRVDAPTMVVPASPLVQQVTLPGGKQVFNTLFLVELGGADGPAVEPGSYQVYLDLGANFLGPYPLAVQ